MFINLGTYNRNESKRRKQGTESANKRSFIFRTDNEETMVEVNQEPAVIARRTISLCQKILTRFSVAKPIGQ
jgi:hypothetical protein